MLTRSVALVALVLALGTVGLQAAAARPTPGSDLAKVDSPLLQLRAAQAGGRDVRRLGAAENVYVSPGGRVLVDVYVRGGVDAAADALRARGMTVQATSHDPFEIVEGLLPVGRVDDAARLDRVQAVAAIHPGGVDAGGTLSQGDAAHRGPAARLFGPTGAGVTVGVISDSINAPDVEPPVNNNGDVSDSQASGDLPADVTVLKDLTIGSDEGRAMAEIIYDGAPGIPRFLFASGTGDGVAPIGPVGKADSINQLVAAGAKVIADDTFFYDEPFFQDGTVSKAVDAARAAGVAYFAAAGNRGRQSYEGSFVSNGGVTGVDEFHDFDPGPGVDILQTVASVPDNGTFSVELQWDEPVGAVETDLGFDIRRADNSNLLASGNSGSTGTGLARESASWTNTTGLTRIVGISISRHSGSRAPFVKYIAGGFGSFDVAEYDTSSDTINPDAASANGALATAAVQFDDPGLDTPQLFSSRGPKVRLFDAAGNRLAAPEVRPKPDIAAADGVMTSVGGFQPFFGTSAAAPSAAAIGALILSAKPTNIAEDVYAILREGAGATDCGVAGKPDTDCGIGFVFADDAVKRALDPTPPTLTPSLTPATPNGRNGFYVRQNVAVSFAAADDGSPISTRRGCDPATVTTDTTPAGTVFTCAVHSAGGDASAQVTVKRDDTLPVVTNLGLKRARFRARKKGKPSAAAKRGSSFRFRLSETATVSITIERKRGRRFRTRRTFTVEGETGSNNVPFSGRIKVRGRARTLKPGTYRVRVTATDPAGNRSAAKRKRFTIVKK